MIGQSGTKASNGAPHRTNISGASYMGIDDKEGNAGYDVEFRNFNPNEGWVFAFDEDVYLETIRLGSQNSDAELTLSSNLFDDIVLADGQPNDIHDMEYRFIPAGTELSLMMTTPTTGTDTGIGVQSITVSSVPFLTGLTVVQAERHDHSIGVATFPSSDDGGGEMVEFDRSGDEISYEVNVQTAGTYLVGFRVASDSGLVNLELSQNGTPLTTLDRLIDAGEWTIVYKMITIQEGASTLTISATDGATQLLDWFELSASNGIFESAIPANPINLALNQSAIASNVHSSGFKAHKAFDGDLNTRWATSILDPWLEVDIGADVFVSGVGIEEYGEQIRAYEIQVYDDGNWKTIYEGGNPEDNQIEWFPTAVGSKFRFQAVEATGNPTIRELKLYGNPQIPMSMEMSGDLISLEWPTIPGAIYSVQRSSDLSGLGSFSETVESGIPALSGRNKFTFERRNDGAEFFRIIWGRND